MRRYLQAIVLVLALGVLVMAGTYRFLQQVWVQPATDLGELTILQVDSGTTTRQIVRQLHELGMLDSVLQSRISLRLFFPDFVLKAGEYHLSGELSPEELFGALHNGVSAQYRLAIIEGRTLSSVLEDILANEALAGPASRQDALAELDSIIDPLAREWMGKSFSAEGWFFPDTYYFARGDSWLSLMGRAHRKMLAVLQQSWLQKSADLPYDNPYQALIMASLVERETGAVEERGEIAGVFVRRLQRGMRLQTDPSVIYGLGDAYQGNITRKHLREDTPYNTYTRGGLPPTPIALPGQGAIHAALNPAPGNTLYFVARGDGRHVFSETLEQHRQAVRHYQVENRRSDYRSSPAIAPVDKNGQG